MSKKSTLTKKKQDIREHYHEAVNIALDVVEQMARDILVEHDELDEFVMAMGKWVFTFKDKGQRRWDWISDDASDRDEYAYLRPLVKFFIEWDNYLHLTGQPMRFTATGTLTTQW